MNNDIKLIINKMIDKIIYDDNLKKSKNIILNLNEKNYQKRKKIKVLEKEIEELNTSIEINTRKKQKLCEHDWETIIVYGDPTSYECKKCNLWSMYRLF